jgi:hypothetical protein
MRSNIFSFSKGSLKGNTFFLMVLLMASLSLNVFLGVKAQRLGNRLNQQGTPEKIQAGAVVTQLRVLNAADQPETINFAEAGKPTVVYIFSPSCVWCERNIESLKTLASLKSNSYRFLAVSLMETNLEKYSKRYQLDIPVYKNMSPDNVRDLRLKSTPQTLVISAEGKVLQNWIGAYLEGTKKEVETFFSIQLPEVREQEEISQAGKNSGCDYCIQDGLSYSNGSVLKAGGRRWRCEPDGYWRGI